MSGFWFLVAAYGQVTGGSISGYLLDPSGEPIVGVPVRAYDSGHAIERHATTTFAGLFRFLDLPAGVYTVSVEPMGFERAQMNSVWVAVNSQVRVDFHPSIAGRREAVSVNTEAQLLPTESSGLGDVVDRDGMEALPLIQRDFLRLALLTPGVSPPVQNSQISIRGNFAMHANGGREEFNNFLLDGVDNNDPLLNRYTLQPPVDAIQEFKIATNGYSAEYGRSAAGQVNVVTRSGVNQAHGFIYEYLRNRALDNRNFFDGSQKPKFIRNQFGGGAGGPVVKNRIFFFANADGLSSREGLSRLSTVPSVAERAGNFSGTGVTVKDPLTGRPFPANRIPPERIHPLASRILDLYPLPNLSGTAGNHLGQPTSTSSEAQVNARMDYYWTAGDQLALRYSFGKQNLFEPFAEAADQIPGFGDLVRESGHNAMVREIHTFGPRIVNTLLLGFNRAVREVLPQNYRTDVNQAWGVNYFPTRSIDFGYPSLNIKGVSPAGDLISVPIDRAENTYQINNVLSMVRGGHGIQLGAEFRKLEHNGLLDVYARGVMKFTGALTGSGMGDLLLGLPAVGIQSQFNNQQTLRSSASNFFVQDDWKIVPHLTLNAGLRYEYNTPPSDVGNRMSVFDLTSRQVRQVGRNGTSRSGIRPQRDNLAPRVGFAWTPGSNLVVRGGYGIYYDSGMFNVNSALYFNPPFFNIRVFVPTPALLLTIESPFPLNGGLVPPPSLSTISPDLTSAYLQHWSLSVEREFHPLGVLSLAYAGSKGTHLIRSRDLNQPRPGPGLVLARVPYPGFSNILFVESGANSEFHSLQATLNRPLRRGLFLLATYMMSKSIDDASAFLGTQADKNFPQDSQHYRLERAVSSFDVHQRATAALVYHLPGGSRLTRHIEASSVITVQGGQPFTPALSFDNSNSGNVGGQFGNDRPELLGNPHLSNPTPGKWFQTAAFAIPPRYTFGSAGRNILRGPGLVSIDLSLRKRFYIRESNSISLEAQIFNLLNRVNFDLPQAVVDQSTAFGAIFSAKAPRQIQVALRYRF